jgi:hypothetical protein
MSQECIQHVKMLGDSLFNKRGALLALWQDLAEQFYPERADFTSARNLGAEMATNLMTSAPLLARRNLANAFSAMLRPSSKVWAKVRSRSAAKTDTEAKQYTEQLTRILRNAQYDSRAGFARATSEADNDFATFGQAVIEASLFRPADGSTPHLLHRCWHLRDVAWMEDHIGKVTTAFRKWEPDAITLYRYFRDKVHPIVKERMEKQPYDYKVNCWHVVVPRDLYETFPGAKSFRQPYVSMYIDCDNMHMLECVGSWVNGYVIPRWQTVSGSQYAHSPATVAALPDARLLQSITLVLLEAGEKAVNPPLAAVQDVIRSDVANYAGGITWLDADYDEKTGAALRPLEGDHKNLGFGMELVKDIRMQLQEAFFLNKLNLPPQGGPDMTAYEVGQRVQEYIRNALPLFGPMEAEYNGQLCEVDLELLMRGDGTIAALAPPSMRGQDVEFEFESPLREALDKAKAQQFIEAGQLITHAMQFDQSAGYITDYQKATRDVLSAVMPAEWMRTEDEVANMQKNAAAQARQQQMLDLMAKGSEVAKTSSEALGNTASTLGLSADAGMAA